MLERECQEESELLEQWVLCLCNKTLREVKFRQVGNRTPSRVTSARRIHTISSMNFVQIVNQLVVPSNSFKMHHLSLLHIMRCRITIQMPNMSFPLVRSYAPTHPPSPTPRRRTFLVRGELQLQASALHNLSPFNRLSLYFYGTLFVVKKPKRSTKLDSDFPPPYLMLFSAISVGCHVLEATFSDLLWNTLYITVMSDWISSFID